MRRLTLFVLILILPSSIGAESYVSPSGPPKYFDPPRNEDGSPVETSEGQDPPHVALEEIFKVEQNVDQVMCGGWIDDSMERWGDIIENPRGFPGRSFSPFAGKETGLGVRGSFQYPEEAYGFMSSCDVFNEEYNPDRLCLIGEGTATPEKCRELYEYWLQKAQEPPTEFCNDSNGEPTIPVPTCYQDTQECAGAACATPQSARFEVRCARNGGPPIVNRRISSFYRHYITPDLGQGVEIWSEGNRQEVRADCYQQYREKDALHTPLESGSGQDGDQVCELNETDFSDGSPTPEWMIPQKADYIPPQAGLNPPIAQRTVDAPWYADSETNMTLLNPRRAKDDAAAEGRDITFDDLPALLSFRPPSTHTAAKDAKAKRTDSFDDATDPAGDLGTREVSTWWEEQQKRLLKIIAVPSVRLLLPARFATGLDLSDPLFNVVTRHGGKQTGVIEVELRAGSDEIGGALDSIQRSWILPAKEVRIPVIVPLMSEAELSNAISQWKFWGERFNRQAEADPFIERLESYRKQINHIRLLRESLAQYLAKVLETQEELRSFFADWYISNADRLRTWLADIPQRTDVRHRWQEINKEFIQLHDECELSYCSNARFTAPIYSLLDINGWMPNRPDLRGLNQDGYQLPDWDMPTDIAADFSSLTIDPASVSIPVLDVMQITVKIPFPPEGGGTISIDQFSEQLPSIPPDELIGNANVFEEFVLPRITLPEKKLIDLPPAPRDFGRVFDTLDAIQRVVDGAKTAYCQFTASVMPENDADERVRQARTIVHSEYDLLERASRLFARRAPQWREDYQGRIERKGGEPETSCTDDVTCVPMPPEKLTSFKWHIDIAAGSSDYFKTAADNLKNHFLPADESINPYPTTLPNLERLFPPVTPLEINLNPPPHEP